MATRQNQSTERKRIKWYAAGNIDLGIIVKDYTLDDLKD